MTILVGCSNDNSNTDDTDKKNIETTNDNSKEKNSNTSEKDTKESSKKCTKENETNDATTTKNITTKSNSTKKSTASKKNNRQKSVEDGNTYYLDNDGYWRANDGSVLNKKHGDELGKKPWNQDNNNSNKDNDNDAGYYIGNKRVSKYEYEKYEKEQSDKIDRWNSGDHSIDIDNGETTIIYN